MSAVFDSLTLRAMVLELKDTILGAQVQKIRQPDAFTVLIRVHGRGVSRWLLLCAHPILFRAHFTTRDFENPQEPPPFCMALRKYLEGGRVLDVYQDGADRVLRIEIASSWGRLCLVAELMGRHSNVILLAENGSILEAMKHVGQKMSHRIVLPGRPYPALPPIGKTSLWDAPEDELAGIWPAAPNPLTPEWLMASFGGMSPALAERVMPTDDPRSTLDGIVSSIRRGETPSFLLNGNTTISEALDSTFGDRAVGDRRGALLRAINAALDREDRALQRRRGDLKRIEENAGRADEWRIAGELLLANLHVVPKGESRVALANYYDSELAPLEIPLDTTLGPRENAEAFFQRHHKARAAFDRLPDMTAELDRLEAAVRARRDQAATADEAALEALRDSLGADKRPADRTGKQESDYPPGVRIKRFVSDEGFHIWIGENATGNDYLTTKASDPSDIWLHVRAAASAHGVIRANKHPEKVPPATLRRAAELVAARSEAKGSGVIPVDYTLRRYVRKPRGAAPGRVTYTNEKTVEVRNEER